jgi:HK97 family phage prohead protease
MELKHIERPFELKAIEDDGTFSGYVSVFNNVDLGGDVILPGAFADSLAAWKAKGALPPVLWQHRTGEPLFLEMREDSVGLWVKGRLLVNDVPRAKEARALLQAKAINGMSIGYVSRDDSWDRVTDVRTLKRVDLYEGSIVTFPMNPMAGVTDVKTRLAALESLADVERHLREAGGFSKAEAVALVSHIKSLSARAEPEHDADLLAGLDALHKSLAGRSESDQLGELLPGLKALSASLT